jgi:signal transduction histidine kinase
MSISTRLLVLIVSLLLPAFGAAGLSVWHVYSEERAQQYETLAEATHSFSTLVEQHLRTYEATLTGLARSPDVAAGNIEAAYRHALAVTPPGSAIVLSMPDGRQLFNTRRKYGAPVPTTRSPALQERFAHADPRHTLVSDMFRARTTGSQDVALQVPVIVDGSIRYFYGLGLQVGQLQPVIAPAGLPPAWRVTLVDRKGVVLARNVSTQFVGTAIRPASQRIIGASLAGRYPSTTLDGVPVVTFFSRVPGADWTVLLSIPNTELQRAPGRAALMLGGAMLLLLAMGTLVAFRMARGAVRAVDELKRVALSLQRRDIVAYRTQGLAELDTVGHVMQGAAHEIAAARDHLEQQVALAITETERVQRAHLQGQKLEALGKLTAGISHEFNNLLQSLSSATQLMQITQDTGKLRSLAANCRRIVERGIALTRQLKTFGRVQETREETILLGEQIDSIVDLLQGVLPAGIALQISTTDPALTLRIDALQLELAVLNVAINARDAMPGGGELTIATGRAAGPLPPDLAPGAYACVSVRDTGSGMTPDVLVRALDPFFTTKPVGTGTGLGLAQAYGFAKQSGGTLTIESAPGSGTTVCFYLPHLTPVSVPPETEAAAIG